MKYLKLYLEKLNPKCHVSFKRPRKEPSCAGNWYENQVIRMNSLKQMMKVISQETNVSFVCTNRSIRGTSVKDIGSDLEPRDIMTLCGHRSEESFQHYSRTGFD